ncbi:hypothetical protein BB560_006423, partial [Smittium megazygosporum]
LDEMVYLDAALSETLRLGTNSMAMKEVVCDVVLPNGVFVSRGSLIKYNSMTNNRSSKVFRKYPHHYIPERHFQLGTKLDPTDIKLLIVCVYLGNFENKPSLGASE